MSEKAAAPPPIDTNDETGKAATVLRRFRKQLAEFPPEWRRWIADSLVAGLPVPDEQAGATE